MNDIAIRAEALGKQFEIGDPAHAYSYRTIQTAITDAVLAPLRALRGRSRPRSVVWALKDVSFDIDKGSVVGVIGRNGAGKSTLLKILSRITEPSHGRATIHGRVGSLLEVGTGFHPELSGRENVYLNGAILGMHRSEIVRKFDDIVAFAEVEKFIDTPVKHYSSGMYLRLAFAVAAHLEPEILLVDEVLAVGDVSFQRKCLTRMREIGGEGRTVVFVSHNMAAVRSLCSRAIVLARGTVVADGPVNGAVDTYMEQARVALAEGALRTKIVDVLAIDVCDPAGGPVATNNDARFTVRCRARVDIEQFGLYLGVSSDGERIFGVDLRDFTEPPRVRAGEQFEAGFVIRRCPLLGGRYEIDLHFKDLGHNYIEQVPAVHSFEVAEVAVYGARQLAKVWFGTVAVDATPLFSK